MSDTIGWRFAVGKGGLPALAFEEFNVDLGIQRKQRESSVNPFMKIERR
jgi:hypothetical protein